MTTKVNEAENSVREFKNWLAVFKTEYDVADEAVEVLNKKADSLAEQIGQISCDSEGKVAADSVKPASNALRDAKTWLATFAQEYDLAEETVKVLHEQFDKVGESLASLECN